MCLQGFCFSNVPASRRPRNIQNAGIDGTLPAWVILHATEAVYAPTVSPVSPPIMLLQVRHILYREDTRGMNFLMHSAIAFEATPTGEVPPVLLASVLL